MAKKKANPNQLVNDKLVELLNQQIQNEFKASAQYVAIAVHFDDASLPLGAALMARMIERRGAA